MFKRYQIAQEMYKNTTSLQIRSEDNKEFRIFYININTIVTSIDLRDSWEKKHRYYRKMTMMLKIALLLEIIQLYIHVASMSCAKMIKESNSKYKILELKCKRCHKIWQYTGLNPYYATCSFCKTSVNIRKNKVQIDTLIDQDNSSQYEQTCEGDLS